MARIEDTVWELFDSHGALVGAISAHDDDTEQGVLDWWNDFERMDSWPFAIAASMRQT